MNVLNEGQSVHIKITTASKPSRLYACMFEGGGGTGGGQDTTEDRHYLALFQNKEVSKTSSICQKKRTLEKY